MIKNRLRIEETVIGLRKAFFMPDMSSGLARSFMGWEECP